MLTWETRFLTHLYRVLDLPPLVAQAAFDAVRDARRLPGQASRWNVGGLAGILELDGDGHVAPPPRPCFWEYRGVEGRIRAHHAWHPAIPVRLELLPWSDTRASLGLSAGGGPLLPGDKRLYQAVGDAALNTLVRELNRWALQELIAIEGALRVPRQPDR